MALFENHQSAEFFCWATSGVAALWMLAVVLVMQAVHYPMFADLKSSHAERTIHWHGKRITPIVLPAMCVELVAAAFLLYLSAHWSVLNAILVAALWGITAFESAKCHAQLATRFEVHILNRLLKGNFVRVVLWGARCFGLVFILVYR